MPSPSMLRRGLAWIDVDAEWGFSHYPDMVLLYWSLCTWLVDKRYVKVCLQRTDFLIISYSTLLAALPGIKGQQAMFSTGAYMRI